MADDGVRVETSPKRIRVEYGGEIVADTTDAKLVWEIPWYPQYYLPRRDVRADRLAEAGEGERHDRLGQAVLLDVGAGGNAAAAAARHYPDSPVEAVRDHVRFEWAAMDAWFEEDEEVFVHPRDPYTRVDILPSSRRVTVVVDGVTVADSTRAHLLFETGLRTRYYLPKTDLRRDLLEPSATTTRCPYKGTAAYYSLRVGDAVHEDLFWYYDHPAQESARIAGLVSFYDERVDLTVEPH